MVDERDEYSGQVNHLCEAQEEQSWPMGGSANHNEPIGECQVAASWQAKELRLLSGGSREVTGLDLLRKKGLEHSSGGRLHWDWGLL